MLNQTDGFVAYLKNKQLHIPPSVLVKAKLCLLDYLGVTCSGAEYAEGSMHEYLSRLGGGGSVSCIGTGVRADALTAAFVNGFHAHAMELDDGHRYGMIHLGAPIISAVLAAAQKSSAAGTAVLEGIVIGYEAAVRLALAIQPSHKKKGFHTAGTCGTIGAAVGAGVVLGLDDVQMKAAISAACTSAAGLLAIQEDGSELKPYNTGHAAMSGLNAAYMSFTGLAPSADMIEGSRGFVKMFAKEYDAAAMTAAQDYFEIERIYMKPYSACRHCHSAIEAAMKLKEISGIADQHIKRIIVSTYKLAVKGHDHTSISGVASAKLSIPFSAATAYLLGSCGREAFTEETVRDPRILALTERITVCENSEFTRLSPTRRVAELTLISDDGRSFCHRVDFAKGDPENPMTSDEVRAKYLGLMRTTIRHKDADRLMQLVYDIENSAEELYAYL